MFEPTTIFQRTHSGRDEIYEKKRGLTQSERLLLIMIDGATSCQGVRAKLPVLSDERFGRAIATLQKKELISEVFLPLEGQSPEQVEQTVIDRFIQQDPTDPLTIISFDPEEDFGVFGPAVASATAHRSAMPPVQSGTGASVTPGMPAQPAGGAEHAMDEALIQQADVLAQEVRARRPQYENPIDQVRDFSVPRSPQPPRPATPPASPASGVHWGYWLIGIGLAFIVGFIAARLSH